VQFFLLLIHLYFLLIKSTKQMKRRSLTTMCALLAAITIFSSSCDKVADAVAAKVGPISFTQTDVMITIPASTNTAQQVSWGTTTFNLDSAIQKQSGVSTLTYAKFAKSVTVTSLIGTVVNGDANNNFNNFTFSSASSPIIIFNTSPDATTATTIGGGTQITPLADPYNWNIPVTGNTDLLSRINGKTWWYAFTYKLQKATTKDLQVKLTINYTISFS
jgi:hypothetical protein